MNNFKTNLFVAISTLASSLVLAEETPAPYFAQSLKMKICNSIQDHLDYDEGVSLRLCVKGAFVIDDWDYNGTEKTYNVLFSWKGKLSTLQGTDDRCSGAAYQKLVKGKKSSRKIWAVDIESCK